jgi:hypothetical protein
MSVFLHSIEQRFNGNFSNPIIERAYAKERVKVRHKLIDQPSYDYRGNVINMPLKQQYPNPSHYYYELFHEICHFDEFRSGSKGMADLATLIFSYRLENSSPPNTNNIIKKFEDGFELLDTEKTLICAYMREEMKSDIVSFQMLNYTGYPITKELDKHFWGTISTARNIILEFEGKEIKTEIENPNSIYYKEINNLKIRWSSHLEKAAKELGLKLELKLKSIDYLKSIKTKKKDRDFEM